MAWKPRTLAALAKGPSSVPNTHPMVKNWESVTLIGSPWVPGMDMVHTLTVHVKHSQTWNKNKHANKYRLPCHSKYFPNILQSWPGSTDSGPSQTNALLAWSGCSSLPLTSCALPQAVPHTSLCHLAQPPHIASIWTNVKGQRLAECQEYHLISLLTTMWCYRKITSRNIQTIASYGLLNFSITVLFIKKNYSFVLLVLFFDRLWSICSIFLLKNYFPTVY